MNEMLTARFKMKDLGKLTYFLGIDFDQSVGCVKMSEKKYIERILERFDMKNCKARETPCKQKLNYADNAEMCDIIKYRVHWKLALSCNMYKT